MTSPRRGNGLAVLAAATVGGAMLLTLLVAVGAMTAVVPYGLDRQAAPTGFAEFPWGTTAEVLTEHFLAKHCRSHVPYSAASGTAWCGDYRTPTLAAREVVFSFEPAGSLAGFLMVLPGSAYGAAHSLTVARYGRPSVEHASTLRGDYIEWRWDGVVAGLAERCGVESHAACLAVELRALAAKRRPGAAAGADRPFF